MDTIMNADIDIEKLLKSVDNEDNAYLMNQTTAKIRKRTLEILKKLHLSDEETKLMADKLKEYRYIEELSEMKYGGFLRWINISDPDNLFLTTGAFFCEAKLIENENEDSRVVIRYKNFMGRIFQFRMEECLIFQKLNQQELVLLAALDHLAK
jgi:hypothetical protein